MKIPIEIIETYQYHLHKLNGKLKQDIQQEMINAIPLFSTTYHSSPQMKCKLLMMFQLITNYLWSKSSGIPCGQITLTTIETMIEPHKSEHIRTCYDWFVSVVSLYIHDKTLHFFNTLINYITIVSSLLLDGFDTKYIVVYLNNIYTTDLQLLPYLQSTESGHQSDTIQETHMIVNLFHHSTPIYQQDPINGQQHELMYKKRCEDGSIECTFNKIRVTINDITRMKGKKDKEMEDVIIKENNHCEINIKSCRSTFTQDDYHTFIQSRKTSPHVTFTTIDITIPQNYAAPSYLYHHRYHPKQPFIPIIYPIPNIKPQTDYYYACYDYLRDNTLNHILIFHVKKL